MVSRGRGGDGHGRGRQRIDGRRQDVHCATVPVTGWFPQMDVPQSVSVRWGRRMRQWQAGRRRYSSSPRPCSRGSRGGHRCEERQEVLHQHSGFFEVVHDVGRGERRVNRQQTVQQCQQCLVTGQTHLSMTQAEARRPCRIRRIAAAGSGRRQRGGFPTNNKQKQTKTKK